MKNRKVLAAIVAIAPASAWKLIVASYNAPSEPLGTVRLLDYQKNTGALNVVATSRDCGIMPTWLDLSSGGSTVTCVDEGVPGSLNLLNINANGSLSKLSSVTTLGGPVSSQFYDDSSAVGLAHYTPPAISSFSLQDNKFSPLQNFTFNSSGPTGPDPARQDSSHVHQALIDPTGEYLLFPDLGADVTHIYRIDANTGDLVVSAPLKAKPGYGPRHAAFWKPEGCSDETYLFIIHELTNRIISYSVTYLDNGDLSFAEVDEVGTFGDRDAPKGANAAEITVSPDNSFLVASNRLAPIFNITNPDPSNSTTIQSDSLVTFKPTAEGKLEFVELVPSGGLHPRHFSFNDDGSLIAVGHQFSGTVLVYARDVETGKIAGQIAFAKDLGPLT
ncbi:3-carboxymuconate cyclase [Paraphoma chrysanthemicola]|uniref:3-carboxymuconate cyclase n=1 Tax=Paraphoma chrysanthemicola TaxID=798071 RepID=A0A8K0VUU5_9PLEO|nr:3-carboxymuconate cyclase [Paraphoma chrysanthemicola]